MFARGLKKTRCFFDCRIILYLVVKKKKSRGGDVAAPAQGENPRRSFFLFPGAPRSRCPADTVHPLSIFVWNRREMLEAARKEVEAANGLNRELGTVRPDMAEEVHR